jgi:hypothetical protein
MRKQLIAFCLLVGLTSIACAQGLSPWIANEYSPPEEGNKGFFSASVTHTGLRFSLKCVPGERHFTSEILEVEQNVYPDFDLRACAAIANNRGDFTVQIGRQRIRLGAEFYEMNGAIAFVEQQETGSAFAELLMSEADFTVSAAPFNAFFPLRASHQAICQTLSDCGIAPASCTSRASHGSTPAAAVQTATFPAAGGSWGGIVRSGPGQEFARVASLREGEPVTLLENTGAMMNGFPWFRIRFRAGSEGFKWGGILYGRGEAVPGAFEICR